MTKNKTIFLLAASALVLIGCNRDEGNLFDTPAALRMNQTLENAEQVLTTAEYGWEFLYFPNPESAGNNIFVQFNENGNAIATGHDVLTKGSPIVTDNNSTWELASDYGPILTFNTYNKVLHAWADPQTDGDGYLGDYEFLILSATQDQVRLKGKKHGGYSILNRLPAPVDYKEYDAQITAMQKKLFSNDNVFTLEQGGKSYMLYYGNTGSFTLQNVGEAIATVAADVYPFAITRTGIQLMSGFLDNTDDKTFTLVGNTLQGTKACLTTGNMVNYFDSYARLQGKSWLISADSCSATVAETVNQVNEQIQTLAKSKKAKLVGAILTYRYAPTIYDKDQYILSVRYTLNGKTNTDVEFAADIKVNGTQNVSVTYIGAENENAKKLLASLPTLATYLNKISGTYNAQSGSINPSLDMTFANTQDANTWYKLTGIKL